MSDIFAYRGARKKLVSTLRVATSLKRKQKRCTTGIETRHYVRKVTYELRRHVSIDLSTVYQAMCYGIILIPHLVQ